MVELETEVQKWRNGSMVRMQVIMVELEMEVKEMSGENGSMVWM